MENQEIFDKVFEHLLKQGCKSLLAVNINQDAYIGDCAYRGANGTKCAAGIFIPDDKYVPEMEGQTICNVGRDYDLGLSSSNLELLKELQSLVHDMARPDKFKRDVEESMWAVAMQFDLEYNIPSI